MKILIVSYEAWRDTNNGGNVLSNIFAAFPDAEIAQIYCSGQTPQNHICKDYYQITESMLLKREKGRQLPKQDYSISEAEAAEPIEDKIKHSIPAPLKKVALLSREILWSFFDWKKPNLECFVTSFQPDVLFAPCYAIPHVSKLALYIKSVAQCPMISYISDDNYTLKRICFSPSFWVNRFITRKWIRNMFAESTLVYTMTDLQKIEYEAIFHRRMKVLCKSAAFSERGRPVGNPIRFIYAGNLSVNRWKTLERLADALAQVNAEGVRGQLHTFSGTKLRTRVVRKLNDGTSTFLHGLISYQELEKQYQASDVAVFVESFDLKSRLATRLSFSTKIIDCLNSGCAVLAIGPIEQGGISYLRQNDAAICVERIGDLPAVVHRLTEQPELICLYAEKANQLGKKNHQKDCIEAMLRRDFFDIAAGKYSVNT